MSRGPQEHMPRVVIAIAPDESYADVTIEGYTQRVNGSGPKETRRAALDLVTSYAISSEQNVVIEAQDANSVWQLLATPAGVVRALSTAPPAPPAASPRPRPRRSSRGLLLVALGGVAVILVLGVLAVVFRPGSEPDTTAAQEEREPPPTVIFEGRPAPPGFTHQSVMRLPLAPETLPAVAPDGGEVALIDADERLTAVGPGGDVRWSAELPAPLAELDGAPRYLRDGDQYRIAVTDGETGELWVWPAEGGSPDHVELPEDATLNFTGGGLLVDAGDEALTMAGDELVPVSVPGGTAALVYDGANVLAASPEGEWAWVSDGGAEPREVEPQSPAGADGVDRLLTASAEHVIIRWSTDDGDTTLLAAHDADDGAVLAFAEVAPEELEGARWVPGDGAAAYGPVLFDLQEGQAYLIDGFAPVSAAGDTVYGEIDESPVAIGADGEPRPLEENTAHPWGLLDGRAVVVADYQLYALNPQ